ncbi:uncharacterized protein N7459_009421 [Penicillium hispanicum]|uniref:uncharacterized protein n=1 Tax=Penicillium hispanicum TaxID=1080232 RepID=UPI0025417CA5|nr:uncharacterized protein N7459_009421 [Penicillium hispanicum]KAJ5569991.1 hypothetical protein N7459_009421 [Penicillium hispanicum]
MSTIPQSLKEPLALGTLLRSDSGQTYNVEEALLERRIGSTFLCVYRASAEGRKYIIKNVIPGEFEYNRDLQKKVSSSPNVRTVVDTIQALELFVYPFLKEDMLSLSWRSLPEGTKKNILRNIKPDNILVDYTENADGLSIKNVQIADLDDSVDLPRGMWLQDALCGNPFWRSPESWCRSQQNQSSDIFSFGIVIIYVMHNMMVFHVGKEQPAAEDLWRPILRRHISYFADEGSLNRLLTHIGKENDFFLRLLELAGSFTPGDFRQPFASWDFVQPELRDLVSQMTSLDPERRITARKALEHPWFSQDS